MNNEIIKWQTYEFEYKHKTKDWFWAVGIISVSLIVISVIFSNYLFGILVLISTTSLFMFANKKPRLVNFELSDKGIAIDKTLYPFSSLESYWISEDFVPAKILLKSKKLAMTQIVIPLSNVDTKKVHDFLYDRLLEEEQHEPFSHHLMEFLGF